MRVHVFNRRVVAFSGGLRCFAIIASLSILLLLLLGVCLVLLILPTLCHVAAIDSVAPNY